MTTDQREHVLYQYHYCKRTYTDIARDLGITSAAISLDRRRHKEEWERQRNLLDFKIKYHRHQLLDNFINEWRKRLIDVISDLEKVKKLRNEELIPAAIAASSDESRSVLADQFKRSEATEVELAIQESALHMVLAKYLVERYDERYDPS